ncbi:TetR family transcriptional regulator [Nocardia wallacei]|uniref:TetR/AcrR family transcriptional regulator n=1 Tax=Nocardia wallacei TaxID=480035 RepID=UPI002455B6DF|nr:TetR family transcriptional regulator [Nocardia wallacei]
MARSADATKTAILAAARARFAGDGYEKATIRAVAADAGIDPSMVMRYFGNKDGLFAAAAEFDLGLPDLTDAPRDSVGAALVEHFLARWQEDNALQILLRTGVTNAGAADRMRAIFAAELAPLIAALCEDPDEAPTRAALVASQILGMALCRYVLKFPPAVDMTDAEIVAWLSPTVQGYLTGRRPGRSG